MDYKTWHAVNRYRLAENGSEVDEAICIDEYDVGANMANLCNELYRDIPRQRSYYMLPVYDAETGTIKVVDSLKGIEAYLGPRRILD